MRRFKPILIILIFFLAPTVSYASNLGNSRISLVEGDVQVKTEDTGDWVPVSINMPLQDGDRIWVPEGGKTELHLRDGTYLRLNQESALEVLTAEKDSFQFYLTDGHVFANFSGLGGTILQIDTHLSSVRAYDRAVFRIDSNREGRTDISVFSGTVYAENRDGRTRIATRETLSLGERGYAEISPLGHGDEWERWNRERDRRLAGHRPPSPYLPEEIRAYSRDFDEYGRWVQIPEYGYVWRPTVVVSAGWAPYRVGRWVWIRGDYVWVSYEPWGWVPYHYGRWFFHVSFGWCWVPPVRGAIYWGPGFVGWVRTPTHVAWVPLAPGEIYYGHGYYGPHSVDIARVKINIEITKTVYRHVHLRNAVTVVHNDTFIRGKNVHVDAKENPFLRREIHAGRPDFKPEKAAAMPVIRDIPRNRRPPEAIKQVHVKEIKDSRPLVRDRERSVFKRGSAAGEMVIKKVEIKGNERGKDGKPALRGKEAAPGKKPEERAVRTPKEARPPERAMEKSQGGKPPERGREEIREIRTPQREIHEPNGSKSGERGMERSPESKSPGREPERDRDGDAVEKGDRSRNSRSTRDRTEETRPSPSSERSGTDRADRNRELRYEGGDQEEPQDSRGSREKSERKRGR